MDKDLRKRLEEAAEKQLNCDTCLARKYGECKENLKCQPYRSYLVGAEHGYKEAIAQAKEWLEKKARFAETQYCNCEESEDDYYTGKVYGLEEALADFETDIKKLWEEKK